MSNSLNKAADCKYCHLSSALRFWPQTGAAGQQIYSVVCAQCGTQGGRTLARATAVDQWNQVHDIAAIKH